MSENYDHKKIENKWPHFAKATRGEQKSVTAVK